MEVETDDLEIDLANNQNQLNYNTAQDDSISYILCPMCQTPIKPNAANLCIRCLNSQYDISEGISKQLVLFQCRQCERFFKNPQWLETQLETAQLLGLCLKKIRGLSKVKLIDAKWIWTEPHSRRLRVEITIEKEVFQNAIVQKSFEIEYILENQQCDVCQASFTHHQWKACVQLRQKATHKRTFLFLEQLILKHNMTSRCLGIREIRDGLDFYFFNKSNALTFLNFIQSMVPIDSSNNSKHNSKRLVSADTKSNTCRYKYSFFAEISNICKDDLVVMPSKLLKKCGGYSPMMICYKVTNTLHFVDPSSLHTIELDNHQFFRHRFSAIASRKHVSVFFIMNCKHMKVRHGKHQLMELELMRESDMENDNPPILDAMTHLGGMLKAGDFVEGYDLQLLASVNLDIESDVGFQKYIKKHRSIDAIIIKKHYSKRLHRSKRKWKLKSLVKDRDYVNDKKAQIRENADKEEFMRELEEDFDMRCRINIFKKQKGDKKDDNDDAKSVVSVSSDGDGEDIPKIPMRELIDELSEMKLDSVNENSTNESNLTTNANGNEPQMQGRSMKSAHDGNDASKEEDEEEEDDDLLIAD